MKAIFTLILFTFTMSFSIGQSGFISDYLKKWKTGAAYTIEFAQVLPETDYDFSPAPEEMSFREQLVHICGNMIWLCGSYLGGEGYERDLSTPPGSKEELIQLLEETFAYATRTIESFDETELNETVDFFDGPLSKRQVLFLLSDHMTHHRGQLVVYLRLKDIKPPSYRGW